MDDNKGKQKIQSSLIEFRIAINDLLSSETDDDDYLLKWLKARNYDVKKAEVMFRKSMEWRRQMNLDDIFNWQPPEILVKYEAGGPSGFDKEGHPIWIDLSSFTDFTGIVKCVTVKDLLKYEALSIETMRRACIEQTKRLGRKIHQAIVILDLEKVSLHHIWGSDMTYFNQIMAMTEANYPEMLKTCYLINAPRMFPLVYNIVKPLLAEDTKSKLKILGSDWKEKLLEVIDADQLPVHWGGTKRGADGDEYCRPEICLGGKVPEQYYASTENGQLEKEDDLESVTVRHGKVHTVTVNVSKAGSALKWRFHTHKHDIHFGITYHAGLQLKDADLHNQQVILATEQCNSHLVQQNGAIICSNIGIYSVTFDNQASWVNNKKLYYRIEVCEPTDI